MIKKLRQQLALESPVSQEKSDPAREKSTDTTEAAQRIQELETRLAETRAALIDQNEENKRVHQEMNQLTAKKWYQFWR